MVSLAQADRAAPFRPVGFVLAGLVLWAILYSQLDWFSNLVVSGLAVPPGTRMHEAVAFFAYDTPKVLLLLTLVVFAMGVVRSFFSPERTRRLLAGRREGAGNVACRLTRHRHAVLLLLGRAAVHRLRLRRRAARRHVLLPDLRPDGERGGARPVVRPGRLAGGAGLSRLRPGIAIVSGWIIGRLHLERWLEPWVRDLRTAAPDADAEPS